MNKTEFKKTYKLYRKAIFDFNCYMESKNFPCGHDDMLYERHSNKVQDFLEQNPVIAQVVEMRYDSSYLDQRWDNYLYYGNTHPIMLKRDIEERLGINRQEIA